MSISTSPPFPPLGDANFNALAYAWAIHMAGVFTTEANALEANVNAKEALATAAAAVAQIALNSGLADAQSNAIAAAASAAAAVAYASTAQATNPDSPIRINPRVVDADFSLDSAYNAASVGPIAIAEGIAVTVGDNATWSIH